ncbi:hypothetical protein ACFU99_08225 [Streptomyces sp. NPDC057654]|uniref:hypothetical protein n=1 Tax=Streptomyces sp. NPDC057654 TaxID=3346196 RepID=UPI00368ED265
MEEDPGPSGGTPGGGRAVVGLRGFVILIVAGAAGVLTGRHLGVGIGIVLACVTAGWLNWWLGD